MAVFTPLSAPQVVALLECFDAGRFTALDEVSSGTENSTFFVTTDRQALVLTLFEQGESDELPFFVDLLGFLASHGLPVANPLCDRQGRALQTLAERPALLFPRLTGEHPLSPTLAQCSAIGGVLGRLHHHSQQFPGSRPNPRDLRWVGAHYPKVMAYLSAEDQQLMLDRFDNLESQLGYSSELPQGALHGDLFRDNALFEGERLTGLIDFYNGCTGDLLFDLAILINDWCSDERGEIIDKRYLAILESYLAARPFSAAERRAWPQMLQLTALRYWLSRLLVIYVDPPAHSLTPKDPTEYRDILRARLEHGAPELPR